MSYTIDQLIDMSPVALSLPFPSGINPIAFTWSLENSTVEQSSIFNGTSQILDFVSTRWKLNILLDKMTEEEWEKISSFFYMLYANTGEKYLLTTYPENGIYSMYKKTYLFSIYDMVHRFPSGDANRIYTSLTTKPSIKTRSSSRNVLWTKGWGNSLEEVGTTLFKPGDYIGYDWIIYGTPRQGVSTKHIIVSGLIPGVLSDGSEDTEDYDKVCVYDIEGVPCAGMKVFPPIAVMPYEDDAIRITDVPVSMYLVSGSGYSLGHKDFKYNSQNLESVEFTPTTLNYALSW